MGLLKLSAGSGMMTCGIIAAYHSYEGIYDHIDKAVEIAAQAGRVVAAQPELTHAGENVIALIASSAVAAAGLIIGCTAYSGDDDR